MGGSKGMLNTDWTIGHKCQQVKVQPEAINKCHFLTVDAGTNIAITDKDDGMEHTLSLQMVCWKIGLS